MTEQTHLGPRRRRLGSRGLHCTARPCAANSHSKLEFALSYLESTLTEMLQNTPLTTFRITYR